jgi:alpha-1,6-mannosyltransferase
MKICDLTQSYAEHGGGIRTFLHAKRDYVLSRTGAEHVLIVPGPEDSTVHTGRSTVHTVKSPLVPGSSVFRLLLRSDKVLRLLRAEQPTIIDAHCAYNLPWTAFRHRSQQPTAVIGYYHTDFPVAYVQPFVSGIAGRRVGTGMRQLAERYARAVYNRFDATVSISASRAESLRARGFEDVRHIPLGVDLDIFSPARRDAGLRERLGVGHDGWLLVYAGRLDAERRPDRVLEMVKRLPASMNARLIMIGDGPLVPRLRAAAAHDDRIRILPFEKDRPMLAALLASSDVYISAMEYETFGLAVVEAQACGLPVLGVRAGAMIDRVPDGLGVLVESNHPDALLHGLLSLDRAAWQECGRAARTHVSHRFSWSRTFDRLFKLYREVLTKRGLPTWPETRWPLEAPRSATG